jgi:hypothetical protein
VSKGKHIDVSDYNMSLMSERLSPHHVLWIRSLVGVPTMRRDNPLHKHVCGEKDYFVIYKSQWLEVRCCNTCKKKYLLVITVYNNKYPSILKNLPLEVIKEHISIDVEIHG